MSVMAFDLASALASIKGPNVVAAPWDAAVAGGGSFNLPAVSTSAAGGGGGGGTSMTAAEKAAALAGIIQGSPLYATAMNAVDRSAAQEAARWQLKIDQANQDIAFAGSRATSGGGGGGGYVGPADPTKAQREALMKVQMETAAHNKELAQERSREVLGSRGMINSGQVPFEQNELQFQYDAFVKELRAQEAIQAAQAQAAYEARKAAAAAASSAGQSAISSQLSAATHAANQNIATFKQELGFLAENKAASAGDVLLALSTDPQVMSWAEGVYKDKYGNTLTPSQATNSVTSPSSSYTPPTPTYPPPPPPAPTGVLMGPGSDNTPWTNASVNSFPSLQGLLAATGFR